VKRLVKQFRAHKEIDYFYSHAIENMPNDPNLFFVSIYPWSDRIILGGVYEQDQKEAIATQEIIDKIVGNAQKCLSGKL